MLKEIGYIVVIFSGIIAFFILTEKAYLERTDYNKRFASSDIVVDIHLTAAGMAVIVYAININLYLFIQVFVQ